MSYSRIIARLIPLSDVAICILGLLLILLVFADFQQSQAKVSVEFFYAHPNGECWYIPVEGEAVKVGIDCIDDIEAIFGGNRDPMKERLPLLILFSLPKEAGEFWTDDRIDELRKTWRACGHLRYITNFPFDLPESVPPVPEPDTF